MSKPVTMIELFYDLVFVYMISRATALIHHLEHGVIAPLALVAFVFVVIVFINSWMVQSVFINRFGQSSWTDIGFTFVDMMIVLYMANSFSAHLHANLQPFYIAAGLLSLTLCLQYLIVLVQTNNAADRNIARAFAAILGGRTLAFLIAGWLPGPLGTIIAVVGVVASWIAPAFTGRYTHQHPIIFGHLLERLTELSIVMFGETIVGIAGFFTQQRFSITSIIIFVIVASLFFAYIATFDHLVDDARTGETGNLLIYLHYPIIFGISMITVSLNFITLPTAKPNFAVTFLYVGITLLYLGLRCARRYQRPEFQCADGTYGWIVGCLMAGYLLSLVLPSRFSTIVVTAIATLASCAALVRRVYQARNIAS